MFLSEILELTLFQISIKSIAGSSWLPRSAELSWKIELSVLPL